MKDVKHTKKYLFAGIALIPVLAWAACAIFGPEREIAVTGECFVKIPKDKLAITLQIRTLNKNAAVSLKDVQKAADDIAGQIKAIDDKTIAIQTKRISSSEKTKWEKNSSVLLGIESEIDLEIVSEKKETIDAVLNGAQGIKNAEIFPRNMRNFSSKAVVDDAVAKCLKVAISDARNKAAAIAAGDGERLGRLVEARFGVGAGDGDVDFARENRLFRAPPMEASFSSDKSADYIQSSDGDLSITVGAVFRIR